MKVKTKKRHENRIIRMEALGELKEIIINEDFLNPEDISVSLCFRGENSSGIIEMNTKEIEILNKELTSKKNLFKGAKVLKFKK